MSSFQLRDRLHVICFGLALLLTAFAAFRARAAVIIEVEAGELDRVDTPIAFVLPQSLRSATHLALSRIDNGQQVDVQILPGQDPRAVWILRDRMPAGTKRTFRLESVDESQSAAARVTCKDNGRQMVLAVGEQRVLEYHHEVSESPPGIPSVYRRSGHIHPLLTPSGRAVTDDFPPDHAHQHGIFFAWVNTTLDNHVVDFWNQAGGTGWVEHVALEDVREGPVFAQFRARLVHSDITSSDEPRPVLAETWMIRTYNLDRCFIVDIESRQVATREPLIINEYHYGGMAVRGQRQWYTEEPNGQRPARSAGDSRFEFTTSEGKDRLAGNHTRPEWVSMSGPIDGEFATLTVMGHPENFRFPQPVRLHPDKPYFCFAPMYLGEFRITAQQVYESKYRFLVYDGPLDEAVNRGVWHDYTEPPGVRIVLEN